MKFTLFLSFYLLFSLPVLAGSASGEELCYEHLPTKKELTLSLGEETNLNLDPKVFKESRCVEHHSFFGCKQTEQHVNKILQARCFRGVNFKNGYQTPCKGGVSITVIWSCR